MPNAIRYGLSAIKNVGEGAMEAAIAEREKNGLFTSLEDFAARLDNRAVNKKLMESLVKAGAFDYTGELRAVMFAKLEQVLASAASMQKDKKAGQGGLFDDFDLAQPKSKKNEPADCLPLSGARMKSSPSKKNCWDFTSAVILSTVTGVILIRTKLIKICLH